MVWWAPWNGTRLLGLLPPHSPGWGTVHADRQEEGVLGGPGTEWGAGRALMGPYFTSLLERPWFSGVCCSWAVSDPAPSWRGGAPPGWLVELWVQGPQGAGCPAVLSLHWSPWVWRMALGTLQTPPPENHSVPGTLGPLT